nr:MAG TPA: hypothetical protein [Caudoviricetes sp.]
MGDQSIPLIIWIQDRKLALVSADIKDKYYSLCYEAMPVIGAVGFSYNISFELDYLGFDSSDVTREFVKRLESIGGTIEDPND